MAQSPQHSPASPEALAQGYEPERIRLRGFIIFAVLFAGAIVGLHALLWKVMQHDEKRAARGDVSQSILSGRHDAPPSPNLQPSVEHDRVPWQDVEHLRQEEDAMFAKFGWMVDTTTHQVRIPPEIAARVVRDAQMRAAGPVVPATTTGKNYNTIKPGGGLTATQEGVRP